MFMGLRNSYHNLASSTNVKQIFGTLTPSWKACVSIQLFVLNKCISASSSGFPANSGLKCDQFNCGTCCIGCSGTGSSLNCNSFLESFSSSNL